ncbi:Protein of unknown function [Anaerobranca gottschalkii DSM 13577]|uniref:Uncharacterized protein n=1 Tax=Anaerobranca gottschalkii DSM 13577 TaxID=1120990 RepID=A0A1I0B0X8_9FIRM|nr:DUF445 family protein [Anaerobranca gottschalkii]SES99588.1 Protein of unknown function [Anaerobranca gottschalkii DSM 13577]
MVYVKIVETNPKIGDFSLKEKINSFPLETLEDIILQIAKRELKYIEILGGILGIKD